MGWTNNRTTTLVIPTGATSGTRIVLDGTTGLISVYDSAGRLRGLITPRDYITNKQGPGVYAGVNLSNTNNGWATLSSDAIGNPFVRLAPAAIYTSTYSSFPGQVGAQNKDGGSNALTQGQLYLISPITDTQTGSAEANIILSSRSNDGTVPSEIRMFADTISTFPTFLDTVPATPTAPPSGSETWHSLSYQNGWSNAGAPFTLGQYRQVASPPNSVQVVGVFTPGTKTDGTTIATLPAGYHPNSTNIFTVYANATVAGAQTPAIELDTSGNLKCFGCSAAGTTSVFMSAIFPLDS